MAGESERRAHALDLAYYNAWHSGLFSQPPRRGKFPDYERYSPRRKRRAQPQTADEMKAFARMFTAAMGGKIIKRDGTS